MLIWQWGRTRLPNSARHKGFGGSNPIISQENKGERDVSRYAEGNLGGSPTGKACDVQGPTKDRISATGRCAMLLRTSPADALQSGRPGRVQCLSVAWGAGPSQLRDAERRKRKRESATTTTVSPPSTKNTGRIIGYSVKEICGKKKIWRSVK